MLNAHHPQVVVNATAYTAVDDAEADETTATSVNGTAPGNLARWCARHGARLLHVSTDYVFDGTATSPYEVDDATAPCNVYGRSKLLGEHAVLDAGGDGHIVRTAWLYGGGPSFIRTVGARLKAGEHVHVVTDQRGAPTWSAHLAQALVALGTASAPPGIWHCTSRGEASWYDVALALAALVGVDGDLVAPTTSDHFPRPARRPAYSVLSNDRWIAAGLAPLPDWRDALREALDRDPSLA
jgi:dTDP-4-dehydrorhamnose reductase